MSRAANAIALHDGDDRQGLWRWLLSAAIILAIQAAMAIVLVGWYARSQHEETIAPAIEVSLAPVQASSPEMEHQDVAVGPRMQQAEEQPKEPPKPEDKPVEQVQPPPQQKAEVTLPTEQQKVDEPKPEYQPAAPETRAPPPTPNTGRFTAAASNAYLALVAGHLQRFKHYPAAAHGAIGKVVMHFVLNRDGKVVEGRVVKSSGNPILDQEALAILHRADPFPPFPAAKPGPSDAYTAPISFDRD